MLATIWLVFKHVGYGHKGINHVKTPAFTLKLCPEVTATEKQVCVLKARMSTGEVKGEGSKNPLEPGGSPL